MSFFDKEIVDQPAKTTAKIFHSTVFGIESHCDL